MLDSTHLNNLIGLGSNCMGDWEEEIAKTDKTRTSTYQTQKQHNRCTILCKI